MLAGTKCESRAALISAVTQDLKLVYFIVYRMNTEASIKIAKLRRCMWRIFWKGITRFFGKK